MKFILRIGTFIRGANVISESVTPGGGESMYAPLKASMGCNTLKCGDYAKINILT